MIMINISNVQLNIEMNDDKIGNGYYNVIFIVIIVIHIR